MTSRRAHTLIEILIVLALLSIIVAIAIPNIGFVNSFKEKQELNELKRDLMYLRSKAITDNCVYDVRIDLKQNRYRLGTHQVQSSIKSKELTSGLKFIDVSVNDDSAVAKFSSSGAPSKSGSFTVQRRNGDRYTFSIVVASGKINIKQIK